MRFVPLLYLQGQALLIPLLTPLVAAGATVTSLGDCDTLRVDDGKKKLTTGVTCIDAPEMAQFPCRQKARELS